MLNKLDKFFKNKSTKEKLYTLLFTEKECGPFDGCCYIVAKALKSILPSGEICLLYGEDIHTGGGIIAHHFLLQVKGGLYLDANGLATEKKVKETWLKKEGVITSKIVKVKKRAEAEAKEMGAHDDSYTIKKTINLIKTHIT